MPPGKNSGQRWLISPFSRRVSGCGVPPASDTCWRAETFVGAKAIMPWLPQLAPRGLRSIAEGQRRSPAHRDLLQLSAREKPQPLAVGREERVDGSFRAGDGLGLQAIHRPQIKLLGAALAGDIREMSAVGREGHSRAILQTCQLLARRQSYYRAGDRLRRRRGLQIPSG